MAFSTRTLASSIAALLILVSGLLTSVSHAQDCVGQADIVFLLDSSRSVREGNVPGGPDNWDMMKQFLNKIFEKLPIDQDDVRIGVLTFATTVHEQDVIYLNQYSDTSDLQSKVSSLKFKPGNTNTSGALWFMRSRLFGGENDRQGVKNYGILVTDGISTVDTKLTIPEARLAKNDDGIRLFTVGISKYANAGELEEIASDPVAYHYFLTEDFSSLSLLVDQLLNRLCEASPPPPTPCKDTRADLTFLLDSSGSIRQKNPDNETDNWGLIKSFVVETISNLNVRADHTRVAVIRFSGFANVVFHLDTYPNSSGMGPDILALDYLDSTTNTSGALAVMRKEVFLRSRGDRPDIRNVGIIITDGESNVAVNMTTIEAELVKMQGIRMFAIGLTSSINEIELRSIASEPSESHFFTALEIADVANFRSQLIWGICNDNCGANQEENPDCWRDVSTLGCEPDQTPIWRAYPGYILVGYNYARLQNIETDEHCKSLCLQDPKCKSVDYVPAYRECAVSYITKDEAPGSFEKEAGANYYELYCDENTRVPNKGGTGNGGSGSGGGSSGGGGSNGQGTGGAGGSNPTTKKPSNALGLSSSWAVLLGVQTTIFVWSMCLFHT